jgi:hypothetical protein
MKTKVIVAFLLSIVTVSRPAFTSVRRYVRGLLRFLRDPSY